MAAPPGHIVLEIEASSAPESSISTLQPLGGGPPLESPLGSTSQLHTGITGGQTTPIVPSGHEHGTGSHSMPVSSPELASVTEGFPPDVVPPTASSDGSSHATSATRHNARLESLIPVGSTSEECQSESRSIAIGGEKIEGLASATLDTPASRTWNDPRSSRLASRAALGERLFGFARAGEVIADRYRVCRRLGSGGMGVVDLARDLELGRNVALKRLLPGLVESIGLQALREEARALAVLTHPNVVAVYDLITGPDTILVMEYVEGYPLHRFVHRAQSASALLEAVCDAGRGLAAAHRAGLIHRDVKPANILVGRNGRARICDFGLARPRLDSTAGETGDLHTLDTGGTPRFMSPEQHAGEQLGSASDQYSLCATAWAVLTGRAPFSGSGQQLEVEKRRGPPTWPAALTPPHPAVPEILRRGLAVRPETRWTSMDALVEELSFPAPRRGAAWLGGGLAVSLGLALFVAPVRQHVEPATGVADQPSGQNDGAHELALEEALADIDRLEGSVAREKFERLAEVAALDGRPDIAAEAAAWRATLYQPSDAQPPRMWVMRARTLDEAAAPSKVRSQLLRLADAVALVHDGDPKGGARAAAEIANARPAGGDDRLRTFARRAQLAGLRVGEDPSRAFALCTSFLESLVTTHPAGHPLLTRTELDCAAVAREAGKPETALRLLSAILGRDAAREDDVAKAHAKIARIHLDAARLDDAERSAGAAAEALERLHGHDAPQLDEVALLRATIASSKGDLAEARRRLEKLRVTVQARLGSDARTLAVVHSRLATVMRSMGDEEAADGHSERAVASFERYGDRMTAAILRANWASGLAERGEYDRAEALLVAARKDLDAHPEHGSQVAANAAWGLIHLGRDEYERARQAFRQAQSVQAAIGGERHPIVGMLMDHEAVAESRLGLDADSTFERAIELQLEGGTPPQLHAFTRLRFARHLWETGRRAHARELMDEALPAARTHLGGARELEVFEDWARRQRVRLPK